MAIQCPKCGSLNTYHFDSNNDSCFDCREVFFVSTSVVVETNKERITKSDRALAEAMVYHQRETVFNPHHTWTSPPLKFRYGSREEAIRETIKWLNEKASLPES